MDIYKAIDPILLDRTPFIFIKKEILEIYEDIKSDEPFGKLECKGKQIIISIIDFLDWKSIHILMKLGHDLLNLSEYQINSIIIECKCDMKDELIYDFHMNGRPWYSWFGYIPNLKFWYYSKAKAFYQLPFLSSKDFLELTYGKMLIVPKEIILERNKYPLLMAQKDPNHLPLRILPSTCFYTKSRRPITSMTNLRQKKFQTLDLSKVPSDILKSGAPFKIGEDYYIPVIRYSNGMRNGCYFDLNDNTEYLGTFYYWEPESMCYLKMGKKFDYFESKLDCAMQMMYKLEQYDEITGGENDNIGKLFSKLERFVQSILDDISDSLKKKYEEYLIFEKNIKRDYMENNLSASLRDSILNDDIISIYQGKEPLYLPITTEYKSTITGNYMKDLFYASEDELDQILANALILLGYHVVIFGRMAGMYRVVSEVMDVRTREESLWNLCWRVD